MSCLTSGWNAFKKVPYFPTQGLSAPTGAIFRGMKTEITNTIMSHNNLYKWEEIYEREELYRK